LGVTNIGEAVMWVRIRGTVGLGTALAQCRRAAGLTQNELAERIGAERTTVINMEAGRNPALERLVQALSLCGYDLVAVARDASVRVVESRDRIDVDR